MNTRPFIDRVDAGRQLAPVIAAMLRRDALVLGIPRGGVVVAAEVARLLELPLGVIVVRKLGAPGREEFALGAIATGVRVQDDAGMRDLGVTDAAMDAVELRERRELQRREKLFAAATTWDAAGKDAVIVDDGIATGATALAACEAVQRRGAGRVVLAVPVAPATWHPPTHLVDEYICLMPVNDFWAVGEFYDDFAQTTDVEVERLLQHPTPTPAHQEKDQS